MTGLHKIHRFGQVAMTALCIGAGGVALSALPLCDAAQAKNNGDHGHQGGADHGGGQGNHGAGSNGNAGGNGNGNGNGQNAGRGPGTQQGGDDDGGPSANAGTGNGAGTDTGTDSSTDTADNDASLSPHGLGKLNGFFHASPQALAHASPNSPIGRLSQTFGAALSAFAAAETADQGMPGGQDTGGQDTGGTPTGPTTEQLGAILAGVTNRPVTAAQVQAIAARLAALHPEDTALAGFADNPDDTDAQSIADAANAARAGADDTTTGDTTTVGDSATDATSPDTTTPGTAE